MKSIYFSIALPFFLIGCGGGNSSISIPSEEVVSPIYNSDYSSEWLTGEYYSSSTLYPIKAYVAYEQGYSGKDTIVAVIDSGINKKHPDLTDNIINGISFSGEQFLDNTIFYNKISFDQIESLKVSSSGSGYTSAPNIIIHGDGVGATAKAILNNDGTIKDVYITNSGYGYTYATVTIDNSNSGGSGLAISNVYLGGDDLIGHGTFISGLIGASKDDFSENDNSYGIQGVAFNASIMPIKVFINGDNFSYTNIIHEGIKYAYLNNADVINISLGSTNSYSVLANSNKDVYLKALENDSTIVIASGNEGLDCLPINGSIDGQCSFPAALPWISGYENLLNQNGGWIVVGSINHKYELSSWSNKAGVTKSNYLVSFGESLTSTNLNNGYSLGSGTSYSAPTVSGAVALMKEKYPHLTGNQISQILFQTATDLGVSGVDSIYGNGLLNLEKAFAPIGTLNIIPSNSSQLSYIGGMIIGQSLGSLNLSSLNNTIALDSFGRDFKINLSQSVKVSDTDSFSFDSFKIMKFKNLLIGVDELNQRGLIGFNYDTLSFLYSQTDDLYGTSSAGLFGLENEKTHYFSLRDTFSFFGFNYGYELNYNIGTANPSNGSLISSVDNLEGYGYRVYLEKNNIGLIYGEESSVRKGNISFKIPTSRNLDGSLNYSSVNVNSFQQPQREVTLYKNFNSDSYALTTGITKKLNTDRLLFDENELYSYVKLNYIF